VFIPNRKEEIKMYALYKDEGLIAMGTLLQIAYKTGVKLRTIQFYKTPAYKKRCKNSKNRRELVKL
jgi:hypothetical protein